MCHGEGEGSAQASLTLMLRQSLSFRSDFLCGDHNPFVICTMLPFVIALLDSHP